MVNSADPQRAATQLRVTVTSPGVRGVASRDMHREIVVLAEHGLEWS